MTLFGDVLALRGFPPIAMKRLGITTNLGAIGGALWHRNSDSVVICVPITTHKLCCDIYFFVLQQGDANAAFFMFFVAIGWEFCYIFSELH